MARRYYSSTAVATTLAGTISNSATSFSVTALVGYPASTPWTAIIDEGTASEEVVTVTNVAGTTLTVTRGADGTSGVSHNAGATFKHGVSARDFDEPNDHVNASSDVHSQYVLKSLADAKGDLFTATGNDTPARLAVGVNNTYLVADSSTSTGLKWSALSLTSSSVPTADVNAQTDSYTLVLADAGKVVEMGKATSQTLTIPTNASVAFPTGTVVTVIQTGAGQVTIAGASGVTVNSVSSQLKIAAQWAAVTLVKRATNTWVCIGALTA